MNDLFGTDEGSLEGDEVFGHVSELNKPEKVQFKPWHQPRKQWVRDKQWWGELRALLRKPIYSDVEIVKYFGLPGGDLLDVEFIRSKLASSSELENRMLLLHGLIDNREDKSSADSRLSQLLDFDNVDQASRIDHFHFSGLASEQSPVWGHMKSSAPYNLVNLDFCNCAFKEDTLTAMFNLMHFQIARQHELPWLFCITTRLDREGVDGGVLSRLDKVYGSLMNGEADIVDEVKRCFEAASEAIDENIKMNDLAMNKLAFSELLQVCFVLWIISGAISRNVKVKLTNAMKYRGDPYSEFADLHSLVFVFEKETITEDDPYGLVIKSGLSKHEIPLDEQIQLKMRAVAKLSKSMDVDEYFESNLTVFEEYKSVMKELLEQCGWNTESYDAQMFPVSCSAKPHLPHPVVS